MRLRACARIRPRARAVETLVPRRRGRLGAGRGRC